MVVNCQQFEFTSNTTTGVQTIVSGLPFTPKGYILFSYKTTADNTFQEHASLAIGVCDGVSGGCVGTTSEDNQASSDATRHHRNPCVMEFRETTDSEINVDGYAVHSSFGADSIVISWTDAPTAAFRVFGLAFGGADFSCEFKEFSTGRTTTGVQAYTTTMSTPQCGFFLATPSSSSGQSAGGHGNMGIGIAISTTKRALMTWDSEDGPSTMDTWSVVDDTKCHGILDGGTGSYSSGTNYVADFSSWDANGFSLNYTKAPSSSSSRFYAFVMKGANFDLGVVAKRTTTGTTQVSPSGVGTVKGLMVFSDNKVKGTTATANARISLGCASSVALQGGGWFGDQDAAATSIITKYSATSSMFISALENATAASSTFQGVAALSDIGVNTFTLNYTTAVAGNAGDLLWWVIGEVTQQNFNGNITETSISVDQTLARTLEANRTISEPSITGSDSVTRILGALRTISEASISINDTLARIQALTKTISESAVSVNQTLTGLRSVPRTISEPAITVDQTLARMLAAIRTVSEPSTSTNDSVERLAQFIRSINQTVSVSEALTRAIQIFKTISETAITINQSITGVKSTGRIISETAITTNDTVTRTAQIIKSISESAITIDATIERIRLSTRSITEPSITTNDTIARLLGATRSPSEDAIVINATVARLAQIIKSISEPSITIDDLVERIKQALRTVSEPAITTDDLVAKALGATRSPSEAAITINDSASRLQTIMKSINESTEIDSSIIGLRLVLRTIAETQIKWYYSLLVYKGGS